MINLNYPIIDLHVHLRDDIGFHTKLARDAGIGTVVYMPNCNPPLDSINKIKKSLSEKRFISAIPVSAITVGRKGKKLVDMDTIAPYVAGFSDDGDCLDNLELLAEAFKIDALIMAHLEPEIEATREYLDVLAKVGGRLHIQHVSKKETIELIKKAKERGLKVTCETCPHYFMYYSEVEDRAVNPPLGDMSDVAAVKRGLADGTIDCIASDYAPIPRPKMTGFASFDSFISLCYGLVLDGTLSESQLKEKIYSNPLKIINQNKQVILDK